MVEETREIELGMKASQAENINFQLEEITNLPTDWSVYLKDTENGELYPMNLENEVPLKTNKKYNLVITTKSVTDLVEGFASEMNVWENNELLNVWLSDANIEEAKLHVFTVTGQKVLQTDWNTVSEHQFSVDHKLPENQLYILKVETKQGTFTKKWMR